ncbi:MAG: hypothetical protein H7Y11_08645 [Armatimonadetes bacterium]|nr:hypothetical protein [Anaerolineae bacterium]
MKTDIQTHRALILSLGTYVGLMGDYAGAWSQDALVKGRLSAYVIVESVNHHPSACDSASSWDTGAIVTLDQPLVSVSTDLEPYTGQQLLVLQRYAAPDWDYEDITVDVFGLKAGLDWVQTPVPLKVWRANAVRLAAGATCVVLEGENISEFAQFLLERDARKP